MGEDLRNPMPELPFEAQSAKLYTMLFDAIPSTVLVVNRALRILSANRNFYEKSRRSVSDTVGSRLSEVFPPEILEHSNIITRIKQAFNHIWLGQGERMSYRSPGQPMRYYYYRIIPFQWHGVVEHVLLLMDDVTEPVLLSQEVRRIERHLVSVVESAPDMVLSTSDQGNVLTWNSAAERLTGYRLDEIKDRPFEALCIESHRSQVAQAFRHILAEGVSKTEEWHMLTKGGESVPIAWVCSPMFDENGGCVTGIVGVGRDLTEQRKLEKQLIQSQKLAALGVIAGGIAHEIRNPLAICFSAAQFLAEDDISEEFRLECAENIRIAANRASAIIDNVLRFSRPVLNDRFLSVDVIQLLSETIELVDSQMVKRGIQIIREFPMYMVSVLGVASRLEQVFMNLFLNAMNAMPDGGILRVRVEQDASDVRVCVVDNGHGMPEAELDKIFDPFYTTSSVGMGLGLWISYSIINEHGGSIEVQSVLNKGSTFAVRFPCLASQPAATS